MNMAFKAAQIILMCIILLTMSACNGAGKADVETAARISGVTDIKTGETYGNEEKRENNMFTLNSKINDVINDTDFGNYGRLIFCGYEY